MSWRAVFSKVVLDISGRSLTLVGGPFPFSAASPWLPSFSSPLLRSIRPRRSVRGDDVQVRDAFVGHHAPGEELQVMTDRPNNRHLRAVWAQTRSFWLLGAWKISKGDSSLKIIRLQSWTDQFLLVLRLYNTLGCAYLGIRFGKPWDLATNFGKFRRRSWDLENSRWLH